ncbi:MAG: YccF domain-containing protein [Pseudonocardiaceae bacterium]
MRTVGNVLWLLFAGLWLAIGYALAGLVGFLLIVTIPFGVASFRLAGYVIWPFGRVVVGRVTSTPILVFLANVLWLIFAGWWLALAHLVFGLLLCLTIIGIPFGVASFKMVPLALVPLGREVVFRRELDPRTTVVASVSHR